MNYSYTETVNESLLHEELIAALSLNAAEVVILGGEKTIVLPDGTDTNTVQGLIDTHDPAGISSAEQGVIDVQAARDALLDAKATEAMDELNASITALSAEVSDLNSVITGLDGISPTQLTALTDITTLASSLDTVAKTLRLVLFALSGREGEGAGSLRWQRREIDYINKTR